jgi:hypothetical protein
MENPRPPFDRALRVVLGTLIGTVGTRSWTNMGRFYSNMVLTSPTSKFRYNEEGLQYLIWCENHLSYSYMGESGSEWSLRNGI